MSLANEASGGRAKRPDRPKRHRTSGLLDSLLRGAPCAMALLEPDLRLTRVNHAFAELVGSELDALEGKPLAEALGQQWADALRPLTAGTPAAPDATTTVEIAAHQGTEPRRFAATCYPLDGGEGFGLAIRDAGPQGSAAPAPVQDHELPAREDESPAPTQAAGHRDGRMRIDAVPAIVLEARLDGTPVLFNERWCDYTGLSLADSVAGAWRRAVHPDDLRGLALTPEALSAQWDSWESEFRLRRADGAYRWHIARRVAEHDDAGNVTGWIATAIDIDDRKRTAEALVASENRYRSLAESVAALVMETTGDGRALWCNQAYLSYSGLPAEQFLGHGWGRIVHPEDAARFPSLLTEVGPVWTAEVRMRRADGEYRWHLGRAVESPSPDGATTWVCTAIDIHDRKLAEEAVAAAESELRQHLNAMPVLVGVHRPGGEPVYFNDAWQRYTGKTIDEMLTSDRGTRYHADDMERIDAYISSPERVRGDFERELRIRRADGHYRWHLVQGRMVKAATGEDLLLVSAVDIHDRKTAEESIQRSAALFRSLGDSLPMLVSVTDANRQLLYLNAGWMHYTGLPQEQLAQMQGGAELYHPEDRPRVAELRSHETATARSEIEVRIRRHDGEYRWHWLQVVPVLGPTGEVLVRAGLAVDIHARKLAEEGLRRHTRQLRELAEAATQINSREAMGHVLAGLTKRARLIIGAHAAITSVAQDQDQAEAVTAISLSDRTVAREPWEALAADTKVASLLHAGDRPIRLSRAETAVHPAFGQREGGELKARVRGWLAVPLVGSDGRNLGLIQLTDRYEGEFDETDEAIVEQLARFATTTIEKSLLLEELAAARIRLETVFEQMPAGVVIVDAASGEVALSNARGARILRHAMPGRNFMDLRSPWRRRLRDGAILPPGEWPITRALSGETVRDEIHAFDRGDGEFGLLSVSAAPIRDESGSIISGIVTFMDVTEQQAAREALRLSEDRYRTLTESLPVAIFTSDPDGDCDYVNESWRAFTGNGPGEDLNDGWKRSLHPEDVPAVEEAWDRGVATGEPVEVEYRLRRWDGVYRWHLERARPLREPEGAVRGWIGHATDIHDQKLAAEREQLLAEIGRQLAMSLDLRETLERVAACAVPNLGDFCLVDILAEDGTAQRVAAAHADPNQTGLLAVAMGVEPRSGGDPVSRVLRTGQPEVVFRTRPRAGTVAEDAVSREYADVANVAGFMVLPLRAHGQVLGTITFVSTDENRPFGPDQVTLAEEVADRAALAMTNARLFAQTRQAAAELAASEERYKMLVEATPTNVSLVDHEGRTIFRNRTLQEYSGRSNSDSFPYQWLQAIHPDERGGMRQSWAQALASGEEVSAEFRLRAADGTYRWHLSEGVPIRDATGKISLWLVVSVDIDEVKQAQQALQRANALKDEFLGLVSHELRTPLTGILGNAQVLLRHWERMEPAARQGALDDIRGEAQRLQRLVENMLVLAGIEGRGEVSTEPLLVQRVVPRIVAAHQARHPSREVRMDFEEGLEPVEASPTYFDQVLVNLLGNAEKYSPANTPIEVTARAGAGVVEVRVLDRGGGITEDEVEEVFRPFYRSARTAATAAGAGLGLAVCKRLLDAQGGRIWAAQREGGGSEFGFALPTGE